MNTIKVNKKSNQSKRIAFVDIAKGFGMLLVIWGHIRETGLSNAMIYAFHMPLFFVLSGMMYQKEKYTSVLQLIRKRIHTILIPYFIYSVVTWGVWVLYNSLLGNEVRSIWMPLVQTVLSQGSGGYLVHNSPLWFVTCLFSVEVIYYFTSKLSLRNNIIICLLLAVLGNVMIIKSSPFRHMVWNIDMAFCAIPFYALGNIVKDRLSLKKIESLILENRLFSALIFTASFVLLLIGARINGPVSMGHRKLNFTLLFYVLAVIGCVGTVILSVWISRLVANKRSFIQWFGRHSFDVMAVQTPIKGVAVVVVAKILHLTTGEVSDSTPYSGIAFLITMIAVIITVYLINRFKIIFKKRGI